MRLTAIWMVMGLASYSGAASAAPWERVGASPGAEAFLAIAIHPTDSAQLLAVSRHVVYESRDGGISWESRFQLPTHAVPRRLAMNAANPPAMLAATSQGLYGSFDGGANWSRVFHRTGPEASDCTFVAFHPSWRGAALLGTRRGLWISSDEGRTWTAVNIPEAARDIIHLAADPEEPDRVYLATSEGLFVGSLTQGGWQQRIAMIHAGEPGVDEPERLEAIEVEEENGSLHRLSAVAIDPQEPATLYVAGSRGLSFSEDHGLTWRPLAGVSPGNVFHMTLQRHSPLAIYLATDQGVASYEPEGDRWRVLSEGLATTQINELTASPEALWAATGEGLYRYATGPAPFPEGEPPSPHELLSNFTHEPTIAQVRDAAIRYAEVYPEKIAGWRRRATLSALLPQVDVGVDQDRSQDARYDEGTFPTFQIVETQDQNAGFDVSVTWKLGDLIWSTDQTSIDVRSKLMVELRDDIVDQLTRTYFERRRMQVALLTDPPSDPKKLMDKELRVQELTAVLDGLTDGYFSEQMSIPGTGR